jgi:outer membrane receptor protein involved in Fe transport
VELRISDRTFVDGARTFAAGPARMDSGLSHVSAHALRAVRVVRGPYALTWGGGAMSAVQLETFKPEFSGGALVVGGRAGANYGENADATDGFAGVWGSSDRLRFALQHNTRTGNDYEDGRGGLIPGDYESFDTVWDLGARPTSGTLVEYSGGYQRQNDIDYPGRILDATLFETHFHSVNVTYRPPGGTIGALVGQVYANFKEHVMNNDEKPTARDMPGLFGIAPFEQQYGIEIHTTDRSRWLAAIVTSSGGQTRVATARFEQPTPGWTTVDLQAGVLVADGVTVKGRVQNLTDELYADHLNSLNPFSRERVPEPGRNAYVGVEYQF